MPKVNLERITKENAMSYILKNEQWPVLMDAAVDSMMNHLVKKGIIEEEHVCKTPERVVKAYGEIFAGCDQNPKDVLSTVFASKYNQMIHVKNVTFYSMCAHHLMPFFGTASFAYIPKGMIVGISKIPRLIEVFARRPQVQEKLTSQVVESFQNIVQPLGCGLVVRAYHFCCMSRGIQQPTSYTETTELAGSFLDASVKQEFLQAALSSVVWHG